MVPENEIANFETFRDCLSTAIIEKLAPVTPKASRKRGGKGRKNEIKPIDRVSAEESQENDAAELADFVEVSSIRHPATNRPPFSTIPTY